MGQNIVAADLPLTIDYFTGKVAGTTRHLETQVSGSGGGGFTHQGTGYSAPVNITSTTTVHDQLFLVSDDGRERAFQLRD